MEAIFTMLPRVLVPRPVLPAFSIAPAKVLKQRRFYPPHWPLLLLHKLLNLCLLAHSERTKIDVQDLVQIRTAELFNWEIGSRDSRAIHTDIQSTKALLDLSEYSLDFLFLGQIGHNAEKIHIAAAFLDQGRRLLETAADNIHDGELARAVGDELQCGGAADA